MSRWDVENPRAAPSPAVNMATVGRTAPRRNMMAKYLLLKHYRGAPASVNDVPMEQWTPEELSAHVQYMDDFAARLVEEVIRQAIPARKGRPDVSAGNLVGTVI